MIFHPKENQMEAMKDLLLTVELIEPKNLEVRLHDARYARMLLAVR